MLYIYQKLQSKLQPGDDITFDKLVADFCTNLEKEDRTWRGNKKKQFDNSRSLVEQRDAAVEQIVLIFVFGNCCN